VEKHTEKFDTDDYTPLFCSLDSVGLSTAILPRNTVQGTHCAAWNRNEHPPRFGLVYAVYNQEMQEMTTLSSQLSRETAFGIYRGGEGHAGGNPVFGLRGVDDMGNAGVTPTTVWTAGALGAGDVISSRNAWWDILAAKVMGELENNNQQAHCEAGVRRAAGRVVSAADGTGVSDTERLLTKFSSDFGASFPQGQTFSQKAYQALTTIHNSNKGHRPLSGGALIGLFHDQNDNSAGQDDNAGAYAGNRSYELRNCNNNGGHGAENLDLHHDTLDYLTPKPITTIWPLCMFDFA
jgi:hypothetical protein